MKRIVLSLTILITLLCLSIASANPLIPGYINELFFSEGGWVLEIDRGGNLDGWSVSSHSGTASLKPGVGQESAFVLITSDSLLTPIAINPAGDSITVKDGHGSGISLTFGIDLRCDVQAPDSGISISFNQLFYLDRSPTLGAENDTIGGMATVLGTVKDSATQLPLSDARIHNFDDDFLLWRDVTDSGTFNTRVYAHNLTLLVACAGYRTANVSLSLVPGDVADTVILLPSITSVSEQGLPCITTLYRNYPNPFNPSTTITFDLPTAGKVTLQVYDALGREVAELVHGFRLPGQYSVEWDGRDDGGVPVGSGIYLARLQLTGAYGEPSVEKAIKLLLVR